MLLAVPVSAGEPVTTHGPCAFVIQDSHIAGDVVCDSDPAPRYLERRGLYLGMTEAEFKRAVAGTKGSWRNVPLPARGFPVVREFSYVAMYEGVFMQVSHQFENGILARSAYAAREEVKTIFDPVFRGRNVQPGGQSPAVLYTMDSTHRACVAQQGILDRMRRRLKRKSDVLSLERGEGPARGLWQCSGKGEPCPGRAWIGKREESFDVTDIVTLNAMSETITLKDKDPEDAQRAMDWTGSAFFGCHLVLGFSTASRPLFLPLPDRAR